MKYSISIVLLLFIIVLQQPSYAALQDEYNVKAGIVGINDKGEFYVKEETNTIPLITREADPHFYFGVIVKSKVNKKFSCSSAITVPRPDIIILNKPDSDMLHKNLVAVNAQVSSKTRSDMTIKSDVAQCKNDFNIITSFDDNDKPGAYIYNIYIDKQLLEKIEFNVISK